MGRTPIRPIKGETKKEFFKRVIETTPFLSSRLLAFIKLNYLDKNE